MTKWLFLAGAIVTEVCGTLALRAAQDHGAWLAVVITGYVASFVFLAYALKLGIPVGVAYGIWSAIGVVSTAIAAYFLFDDPLTWVMGLGIALIIGGVLRLVPLTGITLPFMSYGGSSLVGNFLLLGLLARISHEEQT